MSAAEIIPHKEPQVLTGLATKLPALFVPDAKTAERFFGFFTAHISNDHTRRAYYKAACRFSAWCEDKGLLGLGEVKPPHIAAYIKLLGMPKPEGLGLSKPSVKLQLAALRMLFDWLVVGHALDINPAHAVRGPKYSQKKGKTPVLDREEARALLDHLDVSTLTGLRDRALIATMLYTFARVGAVVKLDVADYFTESRRGKLRLQEKGGKELEVFCHHKLEAYLDEYVSAAGIAGEKDGPLFRSTGRKSGKPQRLAQSDAYMMVARRARQAGIKTKIGNHSLRATGCTDYLRHPDASLTTARDMMNHSDPRTTQLYDRRGDTATLGEYEKVGI